MENTVQLGSRKYLAQLSGTDTRDSHGIDARYGDGKLVNELVDESGLRGCDQ